MSHLRDASNDCAEPAPFPGERLACELPEGHDGPHQNGCSRWGRRPPIRGRYLGADGAWHDLTTDA